jgi:hypothetical protein
LTKPDKGTFGPEEQIKLRESPLKVFLCNMLQRRQIVCSSFISQFCVFLAKHFKTQPAELLRNKMALEKLEQYEYEKDGQQVHLRP